MEIQNKESIQQDLQELDAKFDEAVEKYRELKDIPGILSNHYMLENKTTKVLLFMVTPMKIPPKLC